MDKNTRLFQRKNGALFSGLCNGIAHYIGVTPNYVRIWWLGMSIFIGTKAILIYAVLMFLVPYAKDEAQSTALIDAQTLKSQVLKADVRGLWQHFEQMWNDALRRIVGGASSGTQQH